MAEPETKCRPNSKSHLFPLHHTTFPISSNTARLVVIQGGIQRRLEGRTSKTRDYFRGFWNQPARGPENPMWPCHRSVQGKKKRSVQGSINARLGKQECQSLIIHRCGKEEKEMSKMFPKGRLGALFPSRALTCSHDPRESLGTTGKRSCR